MDGRVDGQRTSMASRGAKCAAGPQAGVVEAQSQNHAQVLKLKFNNKNLRMRRRSTDCATRGLTEYTRGSSAPAAR